MNVIGYIRTSTSRQELSPDAQRAAIATWCQDNGAQLVAVHVDAGVSSVAAVEDRPGARVEGERKTYGEATAEHDAKAVTDPKVRG